MVRPSVRRTGPVVAAALVALVISFFLFASRPPESEATEPVQAVAPDTARDTLQAATQVDTTTSPAPSIPLDTTETVAPSDTPPPDNSNTTPPRRYRAGEDPEFARRMGWPVAMPEPLPGAILPGRRIVAYYGNPLSKRMGVLGEYPKDEMLRRFERQLDEWRRADPNTPVQPALHLIAVVAAGEPGPSGKYRTIMRDTLIETVYGWAKEKNAILFIDIQVGTATSAICSPASRSSSLVPTCTWPSTPSS